MALPEVIQTEQAWRAAMLAREEAVMTAMGERYAQMYETLMADFEALAEQVARIAAEGEAVTVGKVYQLERFQRMAARLEAEFAAFRAFATDYLSAEQAFMLEAGMSNARDVLTSASLEGSFTAGTVEGWPAGAIASMTGQTSGGPLAALIAGATDSAATADAMARSLVEGVGLGRNASVVARDMADRFGLPLARANCIARTEMNSAFRSSTLEGYRQAGVQMYQRFSAQDSVVCEGCASAEGELYYVNEDFEDHPNCRCSCLPYYPELQQFPMGEDWFNTLGEGDQRGILGNTRYEMWKSGEVEFKQFATTTYNAEWGGAVGSTSIRELRAGGGGITHPQLEAGVTPAALPEATA